MLHFVPFSPIEFAELSEYYRCCVFFWNYLVTSWFVLVTCSFSNNILATFLAKPLSVGTIFK